MTVQPCLATPLFYVSKSNLGWATPSEGRGSFEVCVSAVPVTPGSLILGGAAPGLGLPINL